MKHFLSVAVAFAVFVASCVQAEDRSPLKVGMLLGLTGPVAFFGNDIRAGFELCTRGEVAVIFEDHQGQAAAGVTSFNKMVNVDGINVCVTNFSNVADAIIPIARSHKVSLLTTVSSGSLAARAGDNAVNFFATAEKDSQLMATHLLSKRLNTAALFTIEGDYGRSYQQGFSTTFRTGGGAITFEQSYLPTETDFRTLIRRAGASGAQVLVFMGYDSHILNIVRQAKEVSPELILATNWLASDPSLRAGNAELLDGVIATTPQFYLAASPSAAAFIRDFEERFGKRPSAYAALGCDLARLFGEFKDSSSVDLIKSLKKLDGYEGVLGSLSAVDGELPFPLQPAVIRKGELISE